MERIIYKTPRELDFYNLNYSTSLANDLILGSTWGATDATMTVNNPAPSVSGLITQVWLGGGIVNDKTTPAELVNYVSAESGCQLENAIKVIVQQYNFTQTVIIKKMNGQLANYTLDWRDRLLSGEDFVVGSTWSCSDPALNINAITPQINTAGTMTTVWISGGVIGNTYIVTNTVITNMGRVLEQSFVVVVKNYVVGS